MVQRIDITLDGLRQLRRRIDHQQLESDDWPIVGALVSKLIARTEARQARMLAKLAAADAQEAAEDSGSVTDAEPAGPQASEPDRGETSRDTLNAGRVNVGLDEAAVEARLW